MTESMVLSALGLINALGEDKQTIAKRLLSGDAGRLSYQPWLINNEPVLVGAVTTELPEITLSPQRYSCRNNQLLLAAILQIMPEIEALIEQYGRQRIGVVMGSSTSGVSETEQALFFHTKKGEWPATYHYHQQEMGSVSAFVADYFSLKNVAFTISTACSSSGKVFASAKKLIQSGICDAVIVGGVDSLCQLTVNGFNALESIAMDQCNPFSANRKGINIGEAAAVFILQRGNEGIRLLGVGESSDAYHMSAPHPQGVGAIQAIQQALMDSGLSAGDIQYVNLHGTATIKNDEMESIAIDSIFHNGLFCSSTKPMTGHTLGAAGATELAFCWLSMSDFNHLNTLPPQLWDGQCDPVLPVLNFVEIGQKCPDHYRYAMSNTFAFGGSNVSVIIGR